MQQCADVWHLSDDPLREPPVALTEMDEGVRLASAPGGDESAVLRVREPRRRRPKVPTGRGVRECSVVRFNG